MPLYHLADSEIQDRYGVRYLKYWLEEDWAD